MADDLQKTDIVNTSDDPFRGFRNAEEVLTRCTDMLLAEGISRIDISEALFQRVYAILKPPSSGDAAELCTFFDQGIALMDHSIMACEGFRKIMVEEQEDL